MGSCVPKVSGYHTQNFRNDQITCMSMCVCVDLIRIIRMTLCYAYAGIISSEEIKQKVRLLLEF